jgi:hypothetical protein
MPATRIASMVRGRRKVNPFGLTGPPIILMPVELEYV